LDLDNVSIQPQLLVYVHLVGQNLVPFVKSNNALRIDVELYQEVVRWYVLQEHVKAMQKIPVLGGLVLRQMVVLVDIGDI
jgi:hypothetical protein